MSVDARSEIVIELTPKKLLALSLLVVIGGWAIFSYVVALYAFNAPSQDLSMRFNSVGTYDTGNVAKSAFTKGDTVRVKVSFEMADYYWSAPSYYWSAPSYYYYYFSSGDAYRLIYTVSDGSGMPVYFSSVTGTITQAQVKDDLANYISLSSASAGTYTVKVYLWSDWLPGGVVLAPGAGTATFTVT
ncbi:MAG: hypothetical protein Q8O47_01360 [Candidatus Bathyarchaeota archaeon]|nr:hypothetical protein [Candidatus Bathyarchaeota archaeon]